MTDFTIGICSYNNPIKLKNTVDSIHLMTTPPYALIIVDNNSNDPSTIEYLNTLSDSGLATVVFNSDNKRMAGAVNQIFDLAQTEYVCYMDNDIELLTYDWNGIFIRYLGGFHELFAIFPGNTGGAYPIDRGRYTEVIWAVGCCFASRKVMFDQIRMDAELLHQNECDMALRARMKGYKIALAKEVGVIHHASQTTSPEHQKTISDGVVQFITKWNHYFVGEQVDYFSPEVTRFDDWPPNRKHVCEYFKELHLNDNPEQIVFKGQTYDLIRTPKYPHLYRNYY